MPAMARWSGATWRPVKNYSGTLKPIAVTLHHQYGNGSLANFFNGPQQTSAHFWIAKDGRAEQYVDTANRAWHGGGGGGKLNDTSIGVETEGCAGGRDEAMTNAQLDKFAALMRWANQTHGVPLRTSEDAFVAGLNYHRCKNGSPTACPCQVRLNQRGEILKRAGGGGATAPPSSSGVPSLAVDYFSRSHNARGDWVRQWQQRMRDHRKWKIGVDGIYGPESERICRQFQQNKRLAVDGMVGPQTWQATWTAPVG